MSGWLVDTFVATSLLMLLVLLVRRLVRGTFGAGPAYALWLVPAPRLVLPSVQGAPEPIAAVAAPQIELINAAAQSSQIAWLFWLWAAGVLAFALWHGLAYRRFLARVLRGADVTAESGADLVVSDAVEGPAAIGLLKPRIFVPRDFTSRFTPAERALALRHERVHLTRGDLWANAAALGMLALHWFNPIAHRAYKAFREDQELSCDAAVIGCARSDEREAYGRAMVKAAWPAAPVSTCPMTRSHNLKRRLKMVKTHNVSPLARASGLVSVGLLALGGLTLTATGGIAAEPVEGTERIVIKRIAGKDSGKAAADATIANRCGNDPARFETEAVTEKDGKPVKTRLILCSKDGAPAGDRVAALEKARARIASSNELEPANRAKVLAALDKAIAQLKAN